jgi:hypothetical protein
VVSWGPLSKKNCYHFLNDHLLRNMIMNIKDNTTTTFVSCEWSMNTIKGYKIHMKIRKIENFNCRYCHNPSLGLTIKVRVRKSAGQKGSPKVTSHALGSVGEREGMNLHTPKWAPTLWSWSPNGLPNFQRAIARVKTHWITKFFISFERF